MSYYIAQLKPKLLNSIQGIKKICAHMISFIVPDIFHLIKLTTPTRRHVNSFVFT